MPQTVAKMMLRYVVKMLVKSLDVGAPYVQIFSDQAKKRKDEVLQKALACRALLQMPQAMMKWLKILIRLINLACQDLPNAGNC